MSALLLTVYVVSSVVTTVSTVLAACYARRAAKALERIETGGLRGGLYANTREDE